MFEIFDGMREIGDPNREVVQADIVDTKCFPITKIGSHEFINCDGTMVNISHILFMAAKYIGNNEILIKGELLNGSKIEMRMTRLENDKTSQ